MKYEFYLSPEGEMRVVDERRNDFGLLTNQSLLNQIALHVHCYHPKAWEACVKEARRLQPKATSDYWELYAVQRFLRCNFGERDIVPDVNDGQWEFEEVKCPLRGICPHEDIICHPQYQGMAEEVSKHIALYCMGETYDEIGEKLHKTADTVRGSLVKFMKRLGCDRVFQLRKKFRGLHLERRFRL